MRDPAESGTVPRQAGTRVVVCRTTELRAGERKLIDTTRGSIGVFNVRGRFLAIKNSCPHAGAQLCLGKVSGTTTVDDTDTVLWIRDGEILRCPWHQWEFDLVTGRTISEPIITVATYPVTVEDDEVILHLNGLHAPVDKEIFR